MALVVTGEPKLGAMVVVQEGDARENLFPPPPASLRRLQVYFDIFLFWYFGVCFGLIASFPLWLVWLLSILCAASRHRVSRPECAFKCFSLFHFTLSRLFQPNYHLAILPGQGVVKLHGGLVEAEAARGVETAVVGDVA